MGSPDPSGGGVSGPAGGKPVGKRAGGLRGLLQLMRPADRLKLLAVKLGMRIPPLRRRLTDRPVGLRLYALGGSPFHVRPGRQDLATLLHAFIQGQHVPPPPVEGEDLKVICELGANVGASAAALAATYPNAFVLGAEPDPDNAELARRNVTGFGNRCKIVEVALWDEPGFLTLEGPATDALVARPAAAGAEGGPARVEAITLDQLLDRHLPDLEIDYMHVCIEGAEPRVLGAGGSWPGRVRSLRVELYPHFGGEECVAALERLGYRAWFEPEPNSCGYAFGVRESVPAEKAERA